MRGIIELVEPSRNVILKGKSQIDLRRKEVARRLLAAWKAKSSEGHLPLLLQTRFRYVESMWRRLPDRLEILNDVAFNKASKVAS